jgi:hypothetical protein
MLLDGPDLLPRLCTIHKYAFMEQARLVAERVRFANLSGGPADGYIVIAVFLDVAAKDRALENIRNMPDFPGIPLGITMKSLEHPAPGELVTPRLQPLGQVLPIDLMKEIAEQVSHDQDVQEANLRWTMDRMDRDDKNQEQDRDYLIPDLTPEQYAIAAKYLRRKPQ